MSSWTPVRLPIRRAYLHSESLNEVSAIRPSGEVRQIELNLIPAVVEPHWHGADERLHSRRTLIVTGAESSSHVLIVQHLHTQITQHYPLFSSPSLCRKVLLPATPWNSHLNLKREILF